MRIIFLKLFRGFTMGSYQSKCDTKPKPNNAMESDDEYFHDAEDELSSKEMGVQQNLENFQTDAVKSKRPNITNPNITYETMRDIERELSFYEKVSLVFLMFDQEDIALQSLLVEKENLIQQTTINLLYQWAQSESSWKKKIIEGLCIIRNYALLERLGYNKEELKVSHLPNSPYAASNINLMRKALYCIAESLTIQQIEVFLELLEKDFQKKGLHFIQFEKIYLEMYFLQCYSVKYINETNISNIISILKYMNLHQQIEILETTCRMCNPSSNTISETTNERIAKKKLYPVEQKKRANNVCESNLIYDGHINKSTSESCSDHSIISRSSSIKTYPTYEVDPNNVGIMLIINQYKFYVDKTHPHSFLAPEKPLENRDGTEFDRDRLKDTFKKYNFRIEIKENLTDSEMRNFISGAMARFSTNDSCFIVCILSHGEQDSVFAVNSIPVYISELEDILHDTKYPALLGKPKILIIQSCQGKKLQQVIPVEHNYTIDGISSNNPLVLLNNIQLEGHGVPQRRDFLLLMSTVAGFASIRDPQQGTWFIQELCKVIEEDSDECHFEDIMTTVIDKVSNKRWPRDNTVVTMVPVKKTTFSKRLFLTKIQE